VKMRDSLKAMGEAPVRLCPNRVWRMAKWRLAVHCIGILHARTQNYPGTVPEPSRNHRKQPGTIPEPTWYQPGSAGLVPDWFRDGSGLIPGGFGMVPEWFRDGSGFWPGGYQLKWAAAEGRGGKRWRWGKGHERWIAPARCESTLQDVRGTCSLCTSERSTWQDANKPRSAVERGSMGTRRALRPRLWEPKRKTTTVGAQAQDSMKAHTVQPPAHSTH
jgi:hypothetical protein